MDLNQKPNVVKEFASQTIIYFVAANFWSVTSRWHAISQAHTRKFSPPLLQRNWKHHKWLVTNPTQIRSLHSQGNCSDPLKAEMITTVKNFWLPAANIMEHWQWKMVMLMKSVFRDIALVIKQQKRILWSQRQLMQTSQTSSQWKEPQRPATPPQQDRQGKSWPGVPMPYLLPQIKE